MKNSKFVINEISLSVVYHLNFRYQLADLLLRLVIQRINVNH